MKRILKWLKKGAIPHEENGYKPHFLRIHAFLLFLSLFVVLETSFFVWAFYVFPRMDFASAVLESVLIEETNVNRADQKIGALRKNVLLEKAAQMKAEDMASSGYFDHYGPDGTAPWDWIEKTGYEFDYAGENLAVNFYDSDEVIQAWMNSQAHKENILNKNFTEIGIGIAKGQYRGRDTIFVVQMFGSPAEISLALSREISVSPPSAIFSAENSPLSPQSGSERVPKQTFREPKQAAITTNVATETLVTTSNNGTSSVVAGVNTTQSVIHVSSFQKILSAPGFAVKMIYLTIFSLVSLLLILNIFIKIKIQHPPLIVNGILLLVIIASTLVVNHYLLIAGAKII